MKHSPLNMTLLLLLAFHSCLLQAQESSDAVPENLLLNPSFEKSSPIDKALPAAWDFPQVNPNFRFLFDSEDPAEGSRGAVLDTTATSTANQFAMLNQRLDPAALRGKRVRFRAMVKTADRSNSGRAQLWLRVDTESGKIGAFDNMGNRPIVADQWQPYEIVADIDKDARSLVVGMLVLGNAKAWIDDVFLEVVDDSVPVTSQNLELRTPRNSDAQASAPQAFWTPWLLLAALVIVVFFIGQHSQAYRAQPFALRFTLIYFFLYSTPIVVSTFLLRLSTALGLLGVEATTFNQFAAILGQFVTKCKQASIAWANDKVFDFEPISFATTGSGDRTSDFIYLLICLCIAAAIATAWSLAASLIPGRRKAEPVWLRDITRSYLRYVLALTMLSYGLAKTGFIQTQFASGGIPSEGQLNRTFGESSPMGLLWTFMAASPAYTFFGGLGEVIGGVLLVFRRTATMGALVTFGVMVNVVMLNFCYDVPVKQYSLHLVLMALLIAAPEFRRLAKVLVFNQPTEPSTLLEPPFGANRKAYWTHVTVKLFFVLIVVIIPVASKAWTEIQHEHPERPASQHRLIERGFRWINEFPYNR